MIKHYLLIGWRNLLKNPGYSFINIAGLALGISICMLIVLFIRHELSYDDFHKNGDRIFRMVVDRKYPGRSTSYSMIPQSYGAAVKAECPEVNEVVRVFDFLGGTSIQYKVGEKKFEEKKVLFADSTFFKIFDHLSLAGDLNTALNAPHSIVMTESTAVKYFGSVSNAIGKSIEQEGQNNNPLQINAVCADWPDNSHFDFDILVTTAGVPGFKRENYVNFGAHTYILLSPGTSFNRVQARFSDIIKKYAAGNIAQAFAMPFDNFFKAGNGYLYYLQPLKKIHLISHLEGELKPNGSLQAVYIFGAIAVIILLLAIINFINLSTARSSERAKEVGIRKTFGSEKKALVIQFLTESLLISSFSLVLALAMVYFLLPVFVQFTGAGISFSHLLQPFNIFLLISLALITSLLAGLYPAFILSSFKPIAVLKGKFKNSEYGIILRNGLVIFQFAISVILIICTLIVNQQMNYMTGNSLGFNKEQTIILKRTDVLADKTNTFKDEIKAIPGVSNLTGASAFPGDDNYFGLSWRKQGDAQPMTGRGIMTDEEYAHTFDLQLKEGRFFSKDFGTDSLALVLNESAVKELGLKEPIGSTLTSDEAFLNGPDHQQYLYTVVGVIKDYNYQSLHIPITPLVFSNISRFNTSFSEAVKLEPGNIQQTLKLIQQKWNQFLPDRPIDFEFLDQTIARQYVAEVRTQKIFTFFSSLAIFIACIGLLGLAAYACQQRMKEISVRKILGASTPNLIGLLTISFLKSILVSLVIGFPIAWYIMHRWLQDFSYRISITPWTFLLAGGIALGIALLTLSIQTIKAALSNPISTLRSE